MAVIGIDLGGTKISGALFTEEGDFIDKNYTLLEGRTGADVGELVVKHIMNFVEQAEKKDLKVAAIGVCVPGISNTQDNTVWVPNIPGWDKYPLFEEINMALGSESIPVAIEGDRSCYILGESWKGKTIGCENAIFIAVGTGIGAGIIANGHIINGVGGVSGAIGWLGLSRPHLPMYASCGNFESYASGSGIAAEAKRMLTKGCHSNLLDEKTLTSHDVFSAFEQGDPVAIEVVEKAIGYWGMAVANLVSIFNPEKIIFGGGVFGPAAQFLDRILQEAKKWAQPIGITQVELDCSSLKGEAGLVGAGYLAILKS